MNKNIKKDIFEESEKKDPQPNLIPHHSPDHAHKTVDKEKIVCNLFSQAYGADVKLQNLTLWAMIDSGADCNLLEIQEYEKLPSKLKLTPINYLVYTAEGKTSMHILGVATLS